MYSKSWKLNHDHQKHYSKWSCLAWSWAREWQNIVMSSWLSTMILIMANSAGKSVPESWNCCKFWSLLSLNVTYGSALMLGSYSMMPIMVDCGLIEFSLRQYSIKASWVTFLWVLSFFSQSWLDDHYLHVKPSLIVSSSTTQSSSTKELYSNTIILIIVILTQQSWSPSSHPLHDSTTNWHDAQQICYPKPNHPTQQQQQ